MTRDVGDPVLCLEEPSPGDIEYLEERLYEFNLAATGIADGRRLGIFVRDGAQTLLAGVAGHTWGETCELRQVWVAEPLRRKGIGRRLLAEAEAEARRRGCRQIVVTTHSFQAPAFYQRLGFTVVSEVADYPRGHSQVVLMKVLSDPRSSIRGTVRAADAVIRGPLRARTPRVGSSRGRRTD